MTTVPPRPWALQAVLPDELVLHLAGVGPTDARKLVSAVHRHGKLPPHAPAGVTRVAFRAIFDATHVPELALVLRRDSQLDPFVKYAFRGADEAVFETVRIPLERAGRYSVCVSSQVGCALGCTFCATGRLGLVRNLAAWEIVEQVRRVRADLPPGGRVHGVVFQGMGEPLANLEQVVRAARVFSEPSAQAIDARNITISTAGLPSGIRALARLLPNVRLALSMGSATAEKRRSLMPIERSHGLDECLEAAGEHARATDHAPLFAYTLLGGKNDDPSDARALATRVQDFFTRYGKRPRLSLIPYNAIGENDPYHASSPEREAAFRAELTRAGVAAIRRYSGGADVAAACGQLVAAI